MRRPRWMAAVALVPIVALTLTACGGDDGAGEAADSKITVSGTAPENPLVPGNTSEAGGGKIVEVLYSGLMRYDSDTGEPVPEHAEKVDVSEDGKKITYTLKKGWKFHDGTEIKAEHYVKAWNYTAYTPNAQQHSSFFAGVKGYEDVTSEDPDGDGPKKAPTPKKKEMSGVKALDDYTLQVEFDKPMPAFQYKVGYSAFMPLPDAFFENKEAFEKKPIGSGPFKFVKQTANSIVLERFEDYQGPKKPSIKTVEFRFGTPESDYDAVRDNNLDFLNNMPPKALVDNVWQQDLKGRSGPSGNLSIQELSFPLYDPKFKDPNLRKAISMAIDRQQISDKIYGGSRTPVKGYGVPNLPLWEDGACGELCEHNPEKAKELFDKTDWGNKPIEITSNADGGHKEWIEAVCGQIEDALGVECKFVPVQEFGVIREMVNNREMTQIYRAGWGADYPHVENFLNPIFRTGASSNDNGYSNPKVDAKLAEADATVDDEEAARLYHEAEELIAQDMPVIPLWSNPYIAGWSERLENVKVGKLTGELDLLSVRIKSED